MLACSVVSAKFPDRAPAGSVLLRVFLGGALHPEVLELPPERLARLAHELLVPVLDVRARPSWSRAHLFPRAMPQYPVGFRAGLERQRSRAAVHPGLFLCGSTVGAVGIPDAVGSGELVASELLGRVDELGWPARAAGTPA